jgi:hypothetical protein
MCEYQAMISVGLGLFCLFLLARVELLSGDCRGLLHVLEALRRGDAVINDAGDIVRNKTKEHRTI